VTRATTDLTSGLDPALDSALAHAPDGVFRFAENFLFAGYDSPADLALWMHLGTWPDDFGLWEDQVLCALPGDDGMLWAFGYHRTSNDRKPGGGALRFQCIEPFRHWRITFDGVATLSSPGDARSDLVRDGEKRQIGLDLDATMVAPAWDPAAAHREAMAAQSWASAHYQQLLTLAGSVTVDGQTMDFDGRGVRDHSRGQRGQAPEHFGGHDLITAAYPSGRAFGIMRMWDPTGVVNLNAGYVVVDGAMSDAEVIEAPELPPDFRLRGEDLRVVLRSEHGLHELTGHVESSTVATGNHGLGMAFGADPRPGKLVFSQGFAGWTWDGETSHGLTERSNRFR
jgi:hypothetical protein